LVFLLYSAGTHANQKSCLLEDGVMKRTLSPNLQSDILLSAEASLLNYGVLNIPLLAEQIRLRNERENVALEDIEQEILAVGTRLSATMEFDKSPQGLWIEAADC
jgi:hypothetical protein